MLRPASVVGRTDGYLTVPSLLYDPPPQAGLGFWVLGPSELNEVAEVDDDQTHSGLRSDHKLPTEAIISGFPMFPRHRNHSNILLVNYDPFFFSGC